MDNSIGGLQRNSFCLNCLMSVSYIISGNNHSSMSLWQEAIYKFPFIYPLSYAFLRAYDRDFAVFLSTTDVNSSI